MKYPKKADQDVCMGRRCVFTAEYYRDYLKNQNVIGSLCNEIKTPVKWRKQKHLQQFGWVVGFGFVFNGHILKDISYKRFKSTKMVKYVRVRKTPSGPELKIPPQNIQIL